MVDVQDVRQRLINRAAQLEEIEKASSVYNALICLLMMTILHL